MVRHIHKPTLSLVNKWTVHIDLVARRDNLANNLADINLPKKKIKLVHYSYQYLKGLSLK